MEIQRREIALQVAWANYGKPYKWGGDDPMRGFDCSGFVIEVLKSVGLVPRSYDSTAQGLYNLFKKNKASFIGAGCLIFWGESVDKITHVELGIARGLTMGASGGGSRTITTQDAINQNAYIKVRPVRAGHVAVLYPF